MAYMGKTRLKLSCLPPNIKDDHFQSLFASVGQLVECRVVRDENTGLCVGSGFVEYKTEYEAEDAIKMLNGKVVHNKCIKVAHLLLTDDRVPSTKLQIENLPTWCTFSMLGLKFSDFGEVIGCRTETDPQTGLPNGVGFVEFGAKEEAIRAKNCLTGTVLEGASMPLAISFVDSTYNEGYNAEENYAGGNNAGSNEFFNSLYHGSCYPPTFANGPGSQRPRMYQGPGPHLNFEGSRWQDPKPQMLPHQEHLRGPVPPGFQGPRPQMGPGNFQGPRPLMVPGDFQGPRPHVATGDFQGPRPQMGPGDFQGPRPQIGPGDFQGPRPQMGSGAFQGPRPHVAPGDFQGPRPQMVPGDFQGPRPQMGPDDFQGPRPQMGSGAFQGPRPHVAPGDFQGPRPRPQMGPGDFQGPRPQMGPGDFQGPRPQIGPGDFQGPRPQMGSGAFQGPRPHVAPGDFQGPRPQMVPDDFQGPRPQMGPDDFQGPRPQMGSGAFQGPRPHVAPGDFQGPRPQMGPGDFQGPRPQMGPGDFQGPQPHVAPGEFQGARPQMGPVNFQGPRPLMAPGDFEGPRPQMCPDDFQGARPQMGPGDFQGTRPLMGPGDFQGTRPPMAPDDFHRPVLPPGYCGPPSQMPGCQSSRPPMPANNRPYTGRMPQTCQGPVLSVPPTYCRGSMPPSWQGPQMPNGPRPWMHNNGGENNFVQNEFNETGRCIPPHNEFQGLSNIGPVKNHLPNHRYNPVGSNRNS